MNAKAGIVSQFIKKYNIKKKIIRNGKSYEEITGAYFASIRSGAKTRGIEFNLTIKDIWDLFLKQNRLCALTKVQMTFEKGKQTTASLDRINSKLGYTILNVQGYFFRFFDDC